MKQATLILTTFLTVLFGNSFGQDTTIFRQANAAMFSNKYTFIRTNKSDKHGTVYHRTSTDDGQSWYTLGKFKESKRKIYLFFDTTKCNPRLVESRNKIHNDTLYIKWFDWWGNRQDWFRVRFTDTTKNTTYYSADWETGLVKIPMTDLKYRNLSLYGFSKNTKLVDFEVSTGTNEVSIFANYFKETHSYDKRKLKLRKRKDGFSAVAKWTKNKRTLFVKYEK